MGRLKIRIKKGVIRLVGLGMGFFILIGAVQALEEGFRLAGLGLFLLSALCFLVTSYWVRSVGSGRRRRRDSKGDIIT